MERLESYSEQETKNIAKDIASRIENNAVIVLNGELGAGKTKFTEGFLSYFNLENEISSPTFTIVNEYKGDRDVYHFDVYRLADEDEFYDIGGEEYFEKGICIIEWSKLIENTLPKNRIEVTIEKVDENKRQIIIDIL